MKKITINFVFCLGLLSISCNQLYSDFKSFVNGALVGGLICAGGVALLKMTQPESLSVASGGFRDERKFPYGYWSDKTMKDFVGQKNVCEEVNKFIDEVANFEIYKKLGAQRAKALCIEGASGNGKTLLANAIAGELKSYVISANGYWFIDGGGHMGEAVMNLVFEYAKASSLKGRTILFIDNFEAFVSNDSSNGYVNLLNKKAAEELARHIEEIEQNENLIVVAATTFTQGLDSRLFKPGCFDRVIHIPLPSTEGRSEMISHYLQNVSLDESESVENITDSLSEETAGFSVAMLKSMISQAAFIAGREECGSVSLAHLFSSCEELKQRKQFILQESQGEQFYYTFSEKTKFSDVIGQKEVLVEVKEIIDLLHDPDRYIDLGAKKSNGLLLYGPPGCGKTLIARAIAGEANCGFIFVSGAEFIKKYAGTGPMSVRALFDFARKMSKEIPTIIFIDEVDSLGNRAESDSSGAGKERDNTINEILKQMDGFKKNDNILVIAATNLLQKIDAALLRPGRFDRKLLVGLPDREDRRKILLYYLGRVKIVNEELRENIAADFAERSVGFSGADLANLVNESAILAGRYNASSVLREHVEEAFDKIVLGLATNTPMTEEQLRRTAFHEAGHALGAILLNIPLTKVTILPRGKSLGVTWMQERNDYTKSRLLERVMCLQAGYAAEDLVFGDVSVGVSDDLSRASWLVNKIVRDYGLGDGDLKTIVQSAVASEKGLCLFDDEVAKILSESFSNVKNLLHENMASLHLIADMLLERETVAAQEIYDVVGVYPDAKQGVFADDIIFAS